MEMSAVIPRNSAMATKSFCGGRMSSEKTSNPTTTAASVLPTKTASRRGPETTEGAARDPFTARTGSPHPTPW